MASDRENRSEARSAQRLFLPELPHSICAASDHCRLVENAGLTLPATFAHDPSLGALVSAISIRAMSRV